MNTNTHEGIFYLSGECGLESPTQLFAVRNSGRARPSPAGYPGVTGTELGAPGDSGPCSQDLVFMLLSCHVSAIHTHLLLPGIVGMMACIYCTDGSPPKGPLHGPVTWASSLAMPGTTVKRYAQVRCDIERETLTYHGASTVINVKVRKTSVRKS